MKLLLSVLSAIVACLIPVGGIWFHRTEGLSSEGEYFALTWTCILLMVVFALLAIYLFNDYHDEKLKRS
jgi:4-hydroxybenzoate polyprenyltransferase